MINLLNINNNNNKIIKLIKNKQFIFNNNNYNKC